MVSVLESGNLVIEGRRSLKLNEEKQNIYVKGVIRPKDVGRNNTIASSLISDAQIEYEGKGPLSEKAHARRLHPPAGLVRDLLDEDAQHA